MATFTEALKALYIDRKAVRPLISGHEDYYYFIENGCLRAYNMEHNDCCDSDGEYMRSGYKYEIFDIPEQPPKVLSSLEEIKGKHILIQHPFDNSLLEIDLSKKGIINKADCAFILAALNQGLRITEWRAH